MEGFTTGLRGNVRGYTGSPAEMKFTEGGRPVAQVSLGVGGGEGRPVTWVKLVFWEANAEAVINILTAKGMAVVASGRQLVKAYMGKGGIPKPDLSITPDKLEYAKNGEIVAMELVKKVWGKVEGAESEDNPLVPVMEQE